MCMGVCVNVKLHVYISTHCRRLTLFFMMDSSDQTGRDFSMMCHLLVYARHAPF